MNFLCGAYCVEADLEREVTDAPANEIRVVSIANRLVVIGCAWDS